MTQPRQRARRSDAQDNELRILDTARAAFTEAPDATLQSIAKAAGIGQGTIYRHFPNRESLLLAVYRTDTVGTALDELLSNDAERIALQHRGFDDFPFEIHRTTARLDDLRTKLIGTE